MELLSSTIKNDMIQNGVNHAMTYQEFRDLVKELAQTGGTTGHTQTEALKGYTKLNESRMKRWDKTLKISENDVKRIQSFKGNVTWLVIAESWCGDAAHILPVVNKVAALHDNIVLKIVLRDDHDALMNQFLTYGGKSIPKLIMIDNVSGEVVNTFGPRPSIATQLVNDYKAENGALSPAFKTSLQTWYNLNKGQNTISDLIALLNN